MPVVDNEKEFEESTKKVLIGKVMLKNTSESSVKVPSVKDLMNINENSAKVKEILVSQDIKENCNNERKNIVEDIKSRNIKSKKKDNYKVKTPVNKKIKSRKLIKESSGKKSRKKPEKEESELSIMFRKIRERKLKVEYKENSEKESNRKLIDDYMKIDDEKIDGERKKNIKEKIRTESPKKKKFTLKESEEKERTLDKENLNPTDRKSEIFKKEIPISDRNDSSERKYINVKERIRKLNEKNKMKKENYTGEISKEKCSFKEIKSYFKCIENHKEASHINSIQTGPVPANSQFPNLQLGSLGKRPPKASSGVGFDLTSLKSNQDPSGPKSQKLKHMYASPGKRKLTEAFNEKEISGGSGKRTK